MSPRVGDDFEILLCPPYRPSDFATIKGIIENVFKGVKDQTEAGLQAGAAKAAAEMAKAGIPANIAREELTKAADKGAALKGYSRDMFLTGQAGY